MKRCAVRQKIWVEKWNAIHYPVPLWDGTTNQEQIFYQYLIPNGIIRICIKSSFAKGGVVQINLLP